MYGELNFNPQLFAVQTGHIVLIILLLAFWCLIFSFIFGEAGRKFLENIISLSERSERNRIDK